MSRRRSIVLPLAARKGKKAKKGGYSSETGVLSMELSFHPSDFTSINIDLRLVGN